MRVRHSLALLLACSLAFSASPARFSLEQVMSAPFPSDLTAAPKGGAVAWVLNEHGARNVWFADAPTYSGRRLTNYHDDDGQEIAQLTWTPDGRSLIFVRGGDFEMHRDNPNPASLPQGVEQSIWIATLTGARSSQNRRRQRTRRLPTGDRIVFLRKGEIWSVGLENDAKPAQLIHAKGEASELRWSPDGSTARLCIHAQRSLLHRRLQRRRRSHSPISIPASTSDSEPVWSPDGKQIAFVRSRCLYSRVFVRPRSALASPGPFAWPMLNPVTAANYGTQPTARAASFTPWSPTPNCSGARAIASSSLGNAPAGCTCIPSPRMATCPQPLNVTWRI